MERSTHLDQCNNSEELAEAVNNPPDGSTSEDLAAQFASEEVGELEDEKQFAEKAQVHLDALKHYGANFDAEKALKAAKSLRKQK